MASHFHMGSFPASYFSHGGDWSPRISFSHSFAACTESGVPRSFRQKAVPSQDVEFEFSSFSGADLCLEGGMVSADELFCDGKLRPFEGTSDKLGFKDDRRPLDDEEEAKTCRSDKIGRRPASTELWKVAEREGRRRDMGSTPPKVGEVRMPTNSEELITTVCRRPAKLDEKGEKAEQSKSPTSREEMLFPCRRELTSAEGAKRNVPTCRDGMIQARKTVEKVSREDLMAACAKAGHGDDKRGVGHKEDEHGVLQQMRRFSRNPRSASMSMEGSWGRPPSNRSCCVSLNNSRCPSPTRSLSVPSTRPTSPTASSSFSAFSSSSSSSTKYTTRLKEFFKLRKLALTKEAGDVDTNTCRMSRTSLWPFSKHKSPSNGSSKSFMYAYKAEEAGEGAIKGEYRKSKGKEFPPKVLPERSLPYAVASSVRVTPVLNVPGCITPSKKTRRFSFDTLFSRREKF